MALEGNALHILITLNAFFGLAIAFYIHHKKRTNTHLACPLRARCENVVHSKYSKFLGMPVELLGVAYYLVSIIIHVIFIATPYFSVPIVYLVSFLLASGALLFSMYLTFIQIVTLREWCSWCFMSAMMSLNIFILSIVTTQQIDLVRVLVEYKAVLVMIHLLGVTLGLGGATVTDYFTFKALRDYKISDDEARTMHSFSEIIWAGLVLLYVSGIGLYLTDPAMYSQSPGFLAKITAVLVITINGIILNLYISPRMSQMDFLSKITPSGIPIRKLAFALGAISFTSWYVAFGIAMLKNMMPFTYNQYLIGYLLVLISAVIGSQVIEHILSKKALHYQPQA